MKKPLTSFFSILLIGVAISLIHLNFLGSFSFLSLLGALTILLQRPALHGITFLKRAWLGFCLALGYFSISLYWIPNSLYVHYETFYWLIPFAYLFVPLIFSPCFALSFALIPWTSYTGIPRVLLFISSWVLGEVLLGYPFGGLPWSLIGYVWHQHLEIAQISYYITVYGLSALTLGFASIVYLLAQYRSVIQRCLISFLWIGGLAGLYFWGEARMAKPSKQEDLPNIRLVQPSISQKKKWDLAFQRANLLRYYDLSYQSGFEKVDLIIWPEAALTYRLTPITLKNLTTKLTSDQYLITGTLEWVTSHLHNTLIVLNNHGRIVNRYTKYKLVPFGEYIPGKVFLESILPFRLEAISGFPTRPLKTKPATTLTLGAHSPFSPQICFEVIFNNLISSDPSKPKWILNLTNDAWFGNTDGPKQHLHISQFRAIQENLPLVRSATTGISAVIDNYGRIIKKLDYNQEGCVDLIKTRDQSELTR